MSGHGYVLLNSMPLECPQTSYSQLTSSIKENPRLRAAAEELKKTGVKVGDAVSEALKTMEESDIMRAVCMRFHSTGKLPQLALDLQGICRRLIHNREIDGASAEHCRL
jgi:hypothetical protein